MLQASDASTTGAYLSGATGVVRALAGARLVAAAANATAVIREVDGAGRVLLSLAAPANTADESMPPCPFAFTGNVHVTIAGAGATLTLYS